MRVILELAPEDRRRVDMLANVLTAGPRPIMDPLQLLLAGAVIGALLMVYVFSGTDGKGRK